MELNKLTFVIQLNLIDITYISSFLRIYYFVYYFRVVELGGATIQLPMGGGGASVFFEINNFRRTLREINNLLQELFYINM